MKKILLIVVMLISCFSIKAAEYEYVPLLREGVEWNYNATSAGFGSEMKEEYYRVKLIGKITINYKEYYQAYRYRGCEYNEECAHLIAYLREENKKVYVLPASFDKYDIFPGYGIFKEEMVYDFNVKAGDYIIHHDYKHEVITEVKNVEIGGKLRNEYVTEYYSLIEGVGYVGYHTYDLLYPLQSEPTGGWHWHISLNYIRENGEIVYKSPFYDGRDNCSGGVSVVKSDVNVAIRVVDGVIMVSSADALCQAIEIVAPSGELVKKKICDNERQAAISAKDISKGIYIVTVNTNKGIASQKVVI